MVDDDIEELPPLPYDDGLPAPESDMPDMGRDESEVVKDGDWSDFDMDIITDTGVAQSKKGGGFDGSKVTTFKWEDKRYAVPQRWYWGNIVKRMLNHNKAHGYTGCVLIGMSGSGKTTLLNHILNDTTHGMRFAVIENEFGFGNNNQKITSPQPPLACASTQLRSEGTVSLPAMESSSSQSKAPLDGTPENSLNASSKETISTR